MRRTSTSILPLLALMALAGPARALDCHDGFPFAGAQYGLADVVASPRASFYRPAPPCPDGPNCRMPAYLVPGDTVVTGPAAGSALCALYPGETRVVFGAIHRSDLTPPRPADPNPPLGAWVGPWKNGDDGITLRAEHDRIVADGDAYWPSASPSLKDRPGGPNIGELVGTAAPRGNTLTFASDDPNECRVVLTLVTPYMLASDNGQCGGHNVTFTGLYRRKPAE